MTTYYCTVVLRTSAQTTHTSNAISCTRGTPIICTRRQYTYALRDQAALLRTTLSPAVSDCANTEPSVGPNHCACLLVPIMTQHLHSIDSVNSIRGGMDAPPAWRHACMFAKHGKQTDIARTPALHNAASRRKRSAPPAWRRARATLMT